MPFASGGIRKIRRILPQIDFYDLIERLVPKLNERLLDVESGRYLLVGLCQCRRHFGCRDSSSRANRPCGPHDETAPLISLSVPMDASNKKSLNDRVMSVGDAQPSRVSAFNTSL